MFLYNFLYSHQLSFPPSSFHELDFIESDFVPKFADKEIIVKILITNFHQPTTN